MRTRTVTIAALPAAILAVFASATPAMAATAGHHRHGVGGSSPAVTGLAAQWPMNETSGSTMFDTSGNGNDGTIVTPDDVMLTGNGYIFDGSGLVTVPDNDTLDPGSSGITISAQLSVPSSLGSGDYNFLEKGTATARGGAYKMEINGHVNNRHFGAPDCAFNGANGTNVRVQSSVKINDDGWHSVSCQLTANSASITVDGTTKTVRKSVGSIANSKPVSVGSKPNKTHGYVGSAQNVSITIG
jgi:hypothetical protein